MPKGKTSGGGASKGGGKSKAGSGGKLVCFSPMDSLTQNETLIFIKVQRALILEQEARERSQELARL